MEENWKVGDKVQDYTLVDGKKVFIIGTVEKIILATREKYYFGNHFRSKKENEMEEYISKIEVKWDNGKIEVESPNCFDHEDSEYERAFRIANESAAALIKAKLKLASDYLDEAVKVSEETGIAFNSNISFLNQSYMPYSTCEKFPKVDRGFINDITESCNDYDGWEHSAIC